MTVEIVEAARLKQRRGKTMAEAVVEQARAVGAPAKMLAKPLPLRHRTESLVKKDQHRPLRISWTKNRVPLLLHYLFMDTVFSPTSASLHTGSKP